MSIKIFLLCRYDSIRLPGKILKKIKSKPLLDYIIERLNQAFSINDIIVVTSVESSDNKIIDHCKKKNYNFFRGSKNNVAKRFLDCANEFNVEYAVRINGDNLFTDPKIVQSMFLIAETGQWEFITNVKDRTYPPGVSVEIVNISLMNDVYHSFTEYDKEHVMPYFYKNLDKTKIYELKNNEFKVPAGCHLAIDTMDDYELASQIINSMDKPHWEYDTEKIIQLFQAKTGIYV